jgi:hypothetical protein
LLRQATARHATKSRIKSDGEKRTLCALFTLVFWEALAMFPVGALAVDRHQSTIEIFLIVL